MTALGAALRQLAPDHPLMIGAEGVLTAGTLRDIAQAIDLREIDPGTPVALIGGFDAWSVACLIRLADHGCIVLPLTADTASEHQRRFKICGIRAVARDGGIQTLPRASEKPGPVEALTREGRPGLILFTAGTTGEPKAVLHDFAAFLEHRDRASPGQRTVAIFRFDHLAGLDPLLQAIRCGGSIIVPASRDPSGLFLTIVRHRVTLLPSSPSLLRQALRAVNFASLDLSSLRTIMLGSEPIDGATLRRLSEALPRIAIRQNFGITELGFLTLRGRDSHDPYIRFEGPEVSTQTIDGILKVRAPHQMLGYLNAPDPFDENRFLDTDDRIDLRTGEAGTWIRIVGRRGDRITVGDVTIDPVQIEDAVLMNPAVSEAQAIARPNPITGEHIELSVVPMPGADLTSQDIEAHLIGQLPRDHIPARIRLADAIHLQRHHKRRARKQGG